MQPMGASPSKLEESVPSLIRFLTIVGIIIAAFYGSMFMLATFLEPQQHELTKAVHKIELK
jgi:hypothetical protein